MIGLHTIGGAYFVEGVDITLKWSSMDIHSGVGSQGFFSLWALFFWTKDRSSPTDWLVYGPFSFYVLFIVCYYMHFNLIECRYVVDWPLYGQLVLLTFLYNIHLGYLHAFDYSYIV